jgi:hypothetical protein
VQQVFQAQSVHFQVLKGHKAAQVQQASKAHKVQEEQ